MEPFAPSKRFYLIAAAVSVVVVAAATTSVLLLKPRHPGTPLADMIKADLPMLDLVVKLIDRDGAEIVADANTFIADSANIPAGDEKCPALSGGDTRSAYQVSSDDKRPQDCPKQAAWYVKSHPIAFSLYFNDGKEVLAWYDQAENVQSWVGNRFVQGLFFGLLQSLKIKAEDMKLDGLQGEFLRHLLRDAIAAQGQLHYDMAHGNQGWVLSFARQDSEFANRALPVMARFLASSGYRLKKLPSPVLEMQIGLLPFFLTEYQQRIYLAYSLESLLNVIENLTPPSVDVSDSPLALTVRAEAFVDHLPAVMVGQPHFDVSLTFNLKDKDLGALHLPAGRWNKPLHPRIFEGVLASIPHDTFAAVATSFQIPADWTLEDWRKVGSAQADNPPAVTKTDGGLALLWEFDAEHSPNGAFGVVLANPNNPQATPAYTQYLTNPELSAECGGGSVFLAASTESLLTRMKEACARQSLSVLDWQRGQFKQRYTDAQLVSFINPGVGLRELFLAGGAGVAGDTDNDFAPKWKQDYESAKEAMRRDGDKLFNQLPILSYAGSGEDDKAVVLKGYAVGQGVVGR